MCLAREEYTERCVMNNYLGIGLDAKITLDFQNKREEHPEKCRYGDRTVSCYLLGYQPYSFRCPVVAATSAEKKSHIETDFIWSPAGVRSVAGRCPDGVRSRHRALLPMKRARWHQKNPPSSTDAGHRPGYVGWP